MNKLESFIEDADLGLEDNIFMYILYSKPNKRYIKSKFKLFFKSRKHKKEAFLPMYNKLKTESADIETLCKFADFIRLIEFVLFYKNDINRKENRDMIYSDSSINDTKKNLIMILKEDITIKFFIDPRENKLTIDVSYNFGKRPKAKFVIVDREICTETVHQDNLLITINERLQDCMAELFKEYYFKI